MKKTVTILLLLALSVSVIFFSGCGDIHNIVPGSSSLKIGVGEINHVFNPLFAESEGDKTISNLIFGKIRNVDCNNSPVNNFGSITFEPDGKNVKYTVTIKKDLRFSDGSYVTIDDVIFTYHILADASYKGAYKDWYLNDIKGLKEYYYDSRTCSSDFASFREKSESECPDGMSQEEYYQSLCDEYISKNYSNGILVSSISGIKKTGDYSCTVTFSSADINAANALNVYILSRNHYSKEYTKGNADKLRDLDSSAMGCGPYCLKSSEDKVSLVANQYYYAGEMAFKNIEITDVVSDKTDSVRAINNGNLDIVTIPATADTISKISSDKTKVFIRNDKSYTSLFFSTSLNQSLRRALMGICNSTSSLDSAVGSYYSRPTRPLSIRNPEYPSDISELYYRESAFKAYTAVYGTDIPSLVVGYCGDENCMDCDFLKEYSTQLSNNGITLSVKAFDTTEQLTDAFKSDKIDIMLLSIEDNGSADKYQYYNSNGSNNYFNLKDDNADIFTENLHSAIESSARKIQTRTLLDYIMDLCVEWPVYQLQTAIIFNTDKIDESSFDSNTAFDDFTQVITNLRQNNT